MTNLSINRGSGKTKKAQWKSRKKQEVILSIISTFAKGDTFKETVIRQEKPQY